MGYVCLALALSLPLFQEDVSDRLKRDQWKAVETLVAEGERMRKSLHQAAGSTNLDVSFYARAALAELDSISGGEGVPVRRTRQMKGDASLVVADLFRSAGLQVSVDTIPDSVVEVPGGVTFPKALEAVSRELNVEFARDDKGVWRHVGAFRDVPRFVSSTSRVSLTKISKGVYWGVGTPSEPFIWVAGSAEGFGSFNEEVFHGELRVLEAVDEKGRDLRWKKDWYERSMDIGYKQKTRSAPFTAALKAPDPGTRKVARLRLAADFYLSTKFQTFTIENALDGRSVKKVVGDAEAVLTRTAREDGKFMMTLEITAPGVDGRFPGGKGLFMPNLALSLLDAKGRSWEVSHRGSGSNGRTSTRSLTFPGGAGAETPVTLSWSMIVKPRIRSIYFEFRDLPLP